MKNGLLWFNIVSNNFRLFRKKWNPKGTHFDLLIRKARPADGVIMRLTDAKIKGLPIKESRYDIREAGRPGFAVRVAPSGKKTFVFIYTFEGKKYRFTLGEYPGVSLADAHALHAVARKKVKDGINPATEKKEARAAAEVKKRQDPTVSDLIDLYIKRYAKPKKKSWAEDERILNKDVKEQWGSRRASSIKRPEVVALLDSIVDRGAPIQANRTLAVLRTMFGFAVSRGILENSPCTFVKSVAKEKAKERVLSRDEIKRFWDELGSAPMTEAVKSALKVVLITAQRPGEVCGMEWSEIEGRWWTIPPGRVKNKRTHRVYLSGMALEIIGREGEGFVFPSPKEGQAISPLALGHAVRRAFDAGAFNLERFTPHDLRRTAASQMTAGGIARLTVSKVLNHTEGGVTRVYDRNAYDKEKRQALEMWARRLQAIVTDDEGGKVVNLHRI